MPTLDDLMRVLIADELESELGAKAAAQDPRMHFQDLVKYWSHCRTGEPDSKIPLDKASVRRFTKLIREINAV